MNALKCMLAAIGCWVLGTGLGLLLLLILAGPPDDGTRSVLPLAFFGMLYFGFPVWLVAFLPPFLGLRDRAVFWNPLLAGVAGAVAGFVGSALLIGGSFARLAQGPVNEMAFAWTPLFVGAFTFLLGSVCKRQCLARLYRLEAAHTGPAKSREEY
jgi:hypothetical protein